MSNPVDEYLEFKKESSFGSVAKELWRGAKNMGAKDLQGPAFAGAQIAQGALGTVGAASVAGLGAAASKIMGAISKKRDFNEMMDLNNDLQEYQKQDPRMFNAAYSSLRRLNPTYGSDPVVAGSHMRKMMENPDAAGLTLVSSFDKPKAPRRFF